MNKLLSIITIATLLTIVACENDDTDFSSIIGGAAEEEVIDTFVYKAVEFDYSFLSEAEEEIDATDGDYVENTDFSRTVYIEYDGDSVSLSGDALGRVSIVTDGAHVTVTSTTKRMEYVLSGSSDNGSFKIYSENKMKVTLAGLTLHNPTGAAINDQCGKSLYLVLDDGSVNTLSDGSTYTTTEGEDMKGTIFSEGQIILSGAGTLNVNANCKNGIVSDDYLVFRPGNVVNIVNTASHGLKANDGIFIRGGVLNIRTYGDGAKGINSEYNLDITGGRTTIITSGSDDLSTAADTTSTAGIKTDMWLLIEGGVIAIKSLGENAKGIKCSTDLTFTDGDLTVVTLGSYITSSPKGIKADGLIDISGGAIYSYSASADAIDCDGEFILAEGYSYLNNENNLFEVGYTQSESD